ncbi:MAG TPA: hypothetical protein VGL27_08225 [Negativicutes bacterium]|jgi:hypothetical protein
MNTLGEAVEVAKQKVVEDDCGYVVIETEDGYDLQPVREELDIEPNFLALVSATEITFFTHTEEGIIAEVLKYEPKVN